MEKYIKSTEKELLLQEEVDRLREAINRYDDAIADACTPPTQDAIMELIEEFRIEDEEEYGDPIL